MSQVNEEDGDNQVGQHELHEREEPQKNGGHVADGKKHQPHVRRRCAESQNA